MVDMRLRISWALRGPTAPKRRERNPHRSDSFITCQQVLLEHAQDIVLAVAREVF